MMILDKSSVARANTVPMQLADTADLTPAGDFTIELFDVIFTATAGTIVLLSHWNATGNQRSWILQYTGTQLQFAGSTAGTSGSSTTISYTWAPTVGVAYDITIDRSGSTVRIYVDGTKQANGTISGALFNSNDKLYIGSGSASITPFTGTCKAIRITNGVARYATNTSYTVPTLPLPTT